MMYYLKNVRVFCVLAVSNMLYVGATQDCLQDRGYLGSWVHDMDYAKEAQYSSPLHHVTGRTDLRFKDLIQKGEIDLEFRPPTTYRWEDERHECQMQLVEKIEFCFLIEKLDVKRIFFLGDELTQEQAISLWMLLGPLDPTIIGDYDVHMDLTVHCYSGYTFQIVFVRNDELLQTPLPVSFEDGVGNCCPAFVCYCYPWFEEYSKFDGRSVIIANAGLHLANQAQHAGALTRFLEQIRGFQREDDLIFLRTSVPGHGFCQRDQLQPYANLESFTFDSSHYEPHGGQLSNPYNLTLQAHFNHNVLRQASMHNGVHVLDIFPMTILRPDGHLAENPVYRGRGINGEDCIHYSLPGPIDWWNHLFFSNLKTLAESNSTK